MFVCDGSSPANYFLAFYYKIRLFQNKETFKYHMTLRAGGVCSNRHMEGGID